MKDKTEEIIDKIPGVVKFIVVPLLIVAMMTVSVADLFTGGFFSKRK